MQLSSRPASVSHLPARCDSRICRSGMVRSRRGVVCREFLNSSCRQVDAGFAIRQAAGNSARRLDRGRPGFSAIPIRPRPVRASASTARCWVEWQLREAKPVWRIQRSSCARWPSVCSISADRGASRPSSWAAGPAPTSRRRRSRRSCAGGCPCPNGPSKCRCGSMTWVSACLRITRFAVARDPGQGGGPANAGRCRPFACHVHP